MSEETPVTLAQLSQQCRDNSEVTLVQAPLPQLSQQCRNNSEATSAQVPPAQQSRHRRDNFSDEEPARSSPHLPYLTTAEAAVYLRYRTASGIRTAVARGELTPTGAGPKGSHLFHHAELDRFAAARAARYARPCLGTGDARK
ncbi:MAG: helix-turn-helix domain-containing protein, partial [Myxococcota bacterium]|nr:helix-turn-helix domain-containing protein [Myxococcota bacterium]